MKWNRKLRRGKTVSKGGRERKREAREELSRERDILQILL